MSLNPVLSQDVHTKQLLPKCRDGESYILTRPKIKVTLDLSTRKLKGDGDVVLTTHRLVFIKKQDDNFKKGFSSINVPYSHLENPKFNQPIFATNNLEFTVKTDITGQHPLESKGTFRMFFYDGGAEVFLRLFFMFYARFRNNPNLMSTGNPISELEGDNCLFMDPNDPTHVYLSQPQTCGNQQQSTPQEQNQNQQRSSNRFLRFFQGAKQATGLRFVK